jgi:HK97 family phage prohead protease
MTGPVRFPDGIERRRAAELRAVAGRRLEGYSAVFNSPATIGGFTETILPGAFRKSLLSKRDVLALADHDPTRLLARTGSGTLRLEEDARGLHFALDVPDTTLGRDILAMAERGDLGGMSFGFRATQERWPAADRRELLEVALIEISVVAAFPAYPATSVAARSLGLAPASAQARRRALFLQTL